MRFFVFCLFAAAVLSGPAGATGLPPPQTVEIHGGMQGSTGLGNGWISTNPDDVLFTFESSPVPAHMKSEIVPFDRPMPAGSILVLTKKRRLYFVLGEGRAIEYPVGVGKQGFTWTGSNRLARKAEWPSWRPPLAMIVREAERGRDLPEYVEGGEDNPLGARALYLGDTEYRIHGTSQPWSIGRAVSSGCIRMFNQHVIDLYERAEIGALVTVE